MTPHPSDAPDGSPLPRIGPYQIRDVLGQGGMGTVYLADQTAPVRRRVALKVIKLGMDSKQVLARFEQERQALAVMNHPAIAKVFEAGMTEQGQPYFVMEHVEGVTLTEYCDRHRLTLSERILVFQQVCRGVQHAHQKGVVHRDLKPGNILVSQKGDEHVVKIIDFGLARATGHQLIDETIYTEQGQLIGTPEYMSPEQAGGVALEIDTRTDVYSLGVVLYELLAGELPFTTQDLRRAGALEIQRIIREVEPAKPSTRVSSATGVADSWAAQRRLSVVSLRRQLKGDLDWIVLRAMAKEPERRYASALELARDLDRYLQHEPVDAGPPSTTYRLAKFARRYRVQVVAAGLVLAATITGAIVAWSYATTAARALVLSRENEAEARRQQRVAQQQRAVAQTERARFDRLAVVVQLQDAMAGLDGMRPAWPAQLPRIEAWLRDHGDPLQVALPRVRRTRLELEARALPPTAEQRAADRKAHPRFADYRKAERRVESLRRARSRREGGPRAVDASGPGIAGSEPRQFNSFAWPRVSPNLAERIWGQEDRGLAAARSAIAIAEARGDPKVYIYANTLAWALFAIGEDEAAQRAFEDREPSLPPGERSVWEGERSRLEAAIAGAPAALREAEADLRRLNQAIDERWTYEFADDTDRFLHQAMRQAEGELEAFLGPDGARIDVLRRRAWAQRLARLTNAHPNARATWAAAREALRRADGVVASELYGTKHHAAHPIDLQPQMGLVPIGMNPVTKLWEFYHLRSAYDPRSDTDPSALAIPVHKGDGTIPVHDDTGIVFVLLPGATFLAGAQREDPTGPNYDPDAQEDVRLLGEVAVAPMFVARHELTQGQWTRLSLADNPSFYPAGSKNFLGGKITLSHPVETVNWVKSAAILQRHGLILPHETEWEYACRAGTATRWFCGDDPEDLEGFANILDALALTRTSWKGRPVSFEDGHLLHAPVGSYRPNDFGLYDMHGNVFEWCSNLWIYESPYRAARGGSFSEDYDRTRSANRHNLAPTAHGLAVGMRAARRLL